MSEEEARKILKRIDIKFFLCGMNEQSNYIVDEANKVNNAIETVLNLLEKKDKIIDLMIDRIEFLVKINNMGLSPEYDYKDFTKEDIKEYFKKQIK